MSLGYHEIQEAIATQILQISGFRQALTLPDYFGRMQNTLAHKGFVVGLPNTQSAPERQRRSVGVYVQSSIEVKFAYRLRPLDAYPIDYNNALLTERTVTDQILQSYATIKAGIQIRFEGSTRAATDSNEYMIHTLNFIIFHTI
tara:strand:+ start:18 stop:449 length:432 start_codon:yes stop_codon:yes gene_type:complete